MEKKDTSNRYSDTNKITTPNSLDSGIEPSPISEVHRSSTAEGQGASGGTKLKGDGHNLGNININDNTITGLEGKSDVGISIFHNVRVYWSNAGRGQGSLEFKGIFHNIHGNKITAEKGSRKVWLENFGNINYNRKTTSTKDHCKATGGSSSTQGLGGGGGKKPKGDGLNISRNNIKGDPKAYHNFSNFECNLKTTNTEDGCSTSQANILKNTIYNNRIIAHEASYVGMFNFHNVYTNAGFLKHKAISHNIVNNTIEAVNCQGVGIQDFGNIKYN
ncbi:hypothetical protein ACE6H2_001912 [Prunus campanulata]